MPRLEAFGDYPRGQPLVQRPNTNIRSADHARSSRPVGALAAALYGACVALAISYACSYLLVRGGLGVITGPGDRSTGPAVFARAALNLYAIQHVTLSGEGKIESTLGGPESVRAEITLPLTVWAAAPMLALMIGGVAAARLRRNGGRRAIISAGVLTGLIYAAILAGGSLLVRARIDGFLMPEIGGISPNPPQVWFHPVVGSVAVLALGFGIVFGWLGALIVARGVPERAEPCRWWACGKAILVCAMAVQVLMAGSVLAWSLTRQRGEGEERPRIAEMLPTAAGLGYLLIHGATLIGSVESRYLSQKVAQRPFYAQVSLCRGVEQIGSRKALPGGVVAGALAVGVIVAFAAGLLAVRWGSHDGAARTAFRIGVVHAAYLVCLAALCGLRLHEASPVAESTIRIAASLGPLMGVSLVAVFAASLAGAWVAGRSRTRVRVDAD